MPILCEPAVTAGELITSIGGQVRAADSLATPRRAAGQRSGRDPGGDRSGDGDRRGARRSPRTLRLARPAVGVVLARDYVDVALLSRALAVRGAGRWSSLVTAPRWPPPAAGPARCRGGCSPRPCPARTTPARAGRPDRHRLRRQGRLRQDHPGDQPGRRAGQGRRPAGVRRGPRPGVRRRGDQRAARPGAHDRGRAADGRPPGHHRRRLAADPLPARPGHAAGAGHAGRRGEGTARAGRRAARACCAACSTTSSSTRPRSSASTCSPPWTPRPTSCCSPRRTCPR